MDSLDDPRRHVRYHAEHVSNVSNNDFPGYEPGEQHLWNLKNFRKKMTVKVQRVSNMTLEFDLVGVDASIANALRRILIAEVPTMAIETVYLFNNTSVIHDEVLGQRIGLVPIAVDPNMFSDMPDSTSGPNDRNTLVFELNVKCERNKNAKKGETDPEKLYHHANVYSKDLIFKPEGEQVTRFSKRPPRPANDNILLAKLRPGQEIEATLHAFKGTGDMHAKWSPVATASYRLLPHIIIREPIPPKDARKFQSCFAPGVIDVRKNRKGEDEVVIADPRKDTMSREVLRHEEFKDKVELTRIRDFFLFSIESTGCISPEKLFPEAVSVMRSKIQLIKADIKKHILPSLDDIDMENA